MYDRKDKMHFFCYSLGPGVWIFVKANKLVRMMSQCPPFSVGVLTAQQAGSASNRLASALTADARNSNTDKPT